MPWWASPSSANRRLRSAKPEKREAFYEMLLQANTQLYGTQGIALSRLPDTGEIGLIGGLPFKGLELKEFCKSLDEFINKAEEWRETVENFRPAAEEAAVRDEEDAQFRKFGMNGPGFISV